MQSVDGNGEGESKCPMHSYCRTGRDISVKWLGVDSDDKKDKGMCTKYRCNTFYQIDTLEICNRITAYLNKHSRECNGNSYMSGINGHTVESCIAEVVKKYFSDNKKENIHKHRNEKHYPQLKDNYYS